jgi:hypothetical protein
VRTPDIGGRATTRQLGEAIAGAVQGRDLPQRHGVHKSEKQE